jgi:YbbR domain-containing protein
MAIVVSEESGRVIAAKGNKITPVHRKGLLADIMNEHLKTTPKEPHKYPSRERLEILLAAVVSLFFVVGVWFSFSKGLYTLVTVEVPIEYMNRKPSLEIFDTSVNSVELHLSGSGALIKSIEPGQLSVRIDLGKATAGENVFNITQDNISLPPGIYLRKIVPPAVEVLADLSVTKQTPVQADWKGALSSNLIMTDVRISPDTVQIVGPRIAMDDLSTVYTQKIDLDRIARSGAVTVPLAFEQGSFVSLAPQAKGTVVVEYTVVPRTP